MPFRFDQDNDQGNGSQHFEKQNWLFQPICFKSAHYCLQNITVHLVHRNAKHRLKRVYFHKCLQAMQLKENMVKAKGGNYEQAMPVFLRVTGQITANLFT